MVVCRCTGVLDVEMCRYCTGVLDVEMCTAQQVGWDGWTAWPSVGRASDGRGGGRVGGTVRGGQVVDTWRSRGSAWWGGVACTFCFFVVMGDGDGDG